jgi:hypothetical protein
MPICDGSILVCLELTPSQLPSDLTVSGISLILYSDFKSSILFLLRNPLFHTFVLCELHWGLFPQRSKGTIPPEIYQLLTPSEIFYARSLCSTSNHSQSVEITRTLCTSCNRSPCLPLLRLTSETSNLDLHFTCTIRITQFNSGQMRIRV